MLTIQDVNSQRHILQLDGEIWKDLVGYEGSYKVSNLGRIKSVSRFILFGKWDSPRHIDEFIMKVQVGKTGYGYVTLSVLGKPKRVRVNRQVALAFLPNPNNLSDVDHINEDKLDNRLVNLQWLSNHDNRHRPCTIQRTTEITRMANRKKANNIIMYDTDGNLLKKFECISDVTKETGICVSCIMDCVRHKVRKTHDRIFRFEGDDVLFDHKEKQPRKRPVLQCDMDGKAIAYHESLSSAVNALGVSKSSVSKIAACCRGLRKSLYGYTWKYPENNILSQ